MNLCYQNFCICKQNYSLKSIKISDIRTLPCRMPSNETGRDAGTLINSGNPPQTMKTEFPLTSQGTNGIILNWSSINHSPFAVTTLKIKGSMKLNQ